MKNNFLFNIFFILLISGCATEYGSSSNSITGGYSDKMTGKNTASVNFRSNGFTSAEQTRSFAMRRAAELTLERGFDYFLIETGGDFIKETTTPGSVNCYTYGYSTNCNQTGGYNISKPRTKLEIRMFHGEVPNQTGYYDARYLAYK